MSSTSSNSSDSLSSNCSCPDCVNTALHEFRRFEIRQLKNVGICLKSRNQKRIDENLEKSSDEKNAAEPELDPGNPIVGGNKLDTVNITSPESHAKQKTKMKDVDKSVKITKNRSTSEVGLKKSKGSEKMTSTSEVLKKPKESEKKISGKDKKKSTSLTEVKNDLHKQSTGRNRYSNQKSIIDKPKKIKVETEKSKCAKSNVKKLTSVKKEQTLTEDDYYAYDSMGSSELAVEQNCSNLKMKLRKKIKSEDKNEEKYAENSISKNSDNFHWRARKKEGFDVCSAWDDCKKKL